MNLFRFIYRIVFLIIILTALYVVWTRSLEPGNLIIVSIIALVVSLIFHRNIQLTKFSLKKIIYGA